MTVNRADLARYLRQLADLGVDELYLESLTASQVLALAGGQAFTGAAGGAAGAAAGPTPVAPAAAGGATRAAGGAASDRVTGSAATAGAGPGIVPGAVAPAGRAALAAAMAAVAPPSARQAVEAAPAVAANAVAAPGAGLSLLAERAAGCTLCRLHEQRTNVVFGEGDPDADIVVVGEAPGQEEDRTGRPFVGRAGKLLDLLLMTIGRPRPSVYICNVLKCRPPNNRNPMADEVSACTSSLLHGQLEAIAPKVLLAVGKFAAQALLQSEESIGRLRGAVHEYRGRPLVVTYHPAYLLRSPQMTRVAWQDFQLLRKVLDEQA